MKKKLLIALSIMVLATSGTVFAKTKISTDLSEAINLYKQGNYAECYTKLENYIKKDESNALAYYYFAMTNAQLGKTNAAINNYESAITLSSPNSNLNKFAKKGKLCLESPDKCSDSLYSSAEEEFIRNLKGPKMSKPVFSEYERFRLENMMREMNRSNDINPNEFRNYKDFSSMNLQETPSNDEIVAALRTLQRAGLSNSFDGVGLSALNGGVNNESQILNMLGGSSMNSQLIQSLLTNNMTLGF